MRSLLALALLCLFSACPADEPSLCGNGIIDEGEQCDGSLDCTSSCSRIIPPSRCGNGIVEGIEECDGSDDCSSACTFVENTLCGNGTIDLGEECDGSDDCTDQCTFIENTLCGNGVVDVNEVCDDGINDGAYDSCTSDCSARAAHCGDGNVDALELCDDGQNDGTYGSCESNCLALGPHCGDGIINGDEACDAPGSLECTALCERVDPLCGNGVLDEGEVCDDGTNDGTYGTCAVGCLALADRCGDGTLNGNEVCDDGLNDGRYEGCQNDCLAFGPRCGDGIVNGDEACDASDSTCTPTCMLPPPLCGNGVVDEGEVCDDGVNNNAYGTCAAGCASFADRCGDGVINGDELCDDGENIGEYDKCEAGCAALAERCGDGVVNGNELCDDGTNDGSYNGCALGCRALGLRCGDGVISDDEVCDDGTNDGAYGGCESDCSARAAHCGDGLISDDEVCDDGTNDGAYGGCENDCSARAAYCGDGVIDAGEVCDDAQDQNLAGACAMTCDNHLPLIDDLVPISLAARLTKSVIVTASDADGDALTFSLEGPAFASLQNQNGNSVEIYLAPEVIDEGNYVLSLEVSDGGLSDVVAIDLVVEQAPPDDTLCITELQADLHTSILDEDGEANDWIEIHNDGLLDVSLANWCLSDDESNALKWCMNEGVLAPGEHLVIFASGKDRKSGELHTNFLLDNDGEFLALNKPNGDEACAFRPGFPNQFNDISFGLNANGDEVYFVDETPGAANGAGNGTLIRPNLDAIAHRTVALGEVQNIALNASDANGDFLVYQSPTLVRGENVAPFFELVDHNDDSATLTIDATTLGLFEIEVEVSDGFLNDKKRFQVQVIESLDPIVSFADLGLAIGQHPLVADDEGKRFFISLDESFANPQTLSGAFTHAQFSNGYSINLGGIDLSPEDIASLDLTHGDKVPLIVRKDGVTVDTYELVVTNLPLIEMFAETIVDEPKNPGTFRLLSGSDDKDTGVKNLGIEIRGGTARGLPKKAYAFEVRNPYDANESDDVRFENARKDDDWQADAAYRDQSFVRNLVSHDLYRAMRPHAFAQNDGSLVGDSTISGNVAEVILNGRYDGLYVIQERVDRKLLGIRPVEVTSDAGGERWDLVDFSLPENGSLLFKATRNNANFFHPDDVALDFEQKYPKADDVDRFAPFEEFVRFVNESDDATFISEIGERIDMSSMVDFWILRMVAANADTFKKNYYVARNEEQKWFFVPWDFDACYGMSWRGDPHYENGVNFFYPSQNLLLQRLHELPQTGFNTLVKARWTQLRAQLLTPQSIGARFSSYIDRMGTDTTGSDSQARNRNLERWPDTGYLGAGIFELGEVSYIEAWLTDRFVFLDERIANFAE